MKPSIYEDLCFEMKKEGKKYMALCLICHKLLANTAVQRLQAHRNRCKKANISAPVLEIIDEFDSTMGSEISLMDTSISSEVLDVTPKSVPLMTKTASSCTSLATSSSCSSLATVSRSSSTTSLSTPSSKTESCSPHFKNPNFKKCSNLKQYIDNTNKKDADEINDLVARFFFGCNIPLHVVEAEPFKDLIKKLRPSCVKILPSRKTLSTTLLDKEYERQILKAKMLISDESVLLIDGWKNTASNTKTVVTMLHNANGEKAFLDAWDLSGEVENSEKLAEIVEKSIALALNLYNTKVYAVVSDNAANMVKMGKLVEIWHSNCGAHVANLLAKDLLNKTLVSNLNSVLKEFRHPDLERAILEKGGVKVKIPCETRWSTHRDCCICLKKNLKFMRELVIDLPKKIKTHIKNLLFDDEFIEKIDELIELLDPVSHLINKLQATDFSIADSVNLWLSLNSNGNSLMQEKIDGRRKQALNIYGIVAFYLNPYFDQNKLDPEQKDVATNFLFHNLDGQGMYELDLYLNRKEYFGICCNKDLNQNVCLFWRLCSLKYSNISKLALKLMNIPASSAQLERVFSNWGYIHSNVRNRLTFERSKKLLHIYYNTKINVNNGFSED